MVPAGPRGRRTSEQPRGTAAVAASCKRALGVRDKRVRRYRWRVQANERRRSWRGMETLNWECGSRCLASAVLCSHIQLCCCRWYGPASATAGPGAFLTVRLAAPSRGGCWCHDGQLRSGAVPSRGRGDVARRALPERKLTTLDGWCLGDTWREGASGLHARSSHPGPVMCAQALAPHPI